MNQAVRHLSVFEEDVVAAPGAAEPVCAIVDPKPGVCLLIANVCADLGIRAHRFDTVPELIAEGARLVPDVIFIEPGIDGRDGDEVIPALAGHGFRCPIQLMSGLNPVLAEEARRLGERRGLTMLPVLEKPFRVPAVKQIIEQLGLRRDALANVHVTIGDALKYSWLELWYQPKIDLRGRVFAGAEGYVRARHPDHGVVPPESLFSGASTDEMLNLTKHVMTTALRDWSVFASVGLPIRFSINVPMVALEKLSIATIVTQHRPKAAHWPGLVLEINEDEIIKDLSLVQKVEKELRPLGISFAVDDFGRAYSTIAQLKDVPFSELKIDRSFVANCNADRMNAGLCQTIIELAHRLGSKAVAEGVETAAELRALHGMGCDTGQGYLFARPMPRDHFLRLLRERGQGRRS
ncbi:MAG TPA: EAL domain-containing response regulator [Xanthobacteraceae bacterium]|nr:EAL domain-containing response regulator [Xanthobacteraceae bacterium]